MKISKNAQPNHKHTYFPTNTPLTNTQKAQPQPTHSAQHHKHWRTECIEPHTPCTQAGVRVPPCTHMHKVSLITTTYMHTHMCAQNLYNQIHASMNASTSMCSRLNEFTCPRALRYYDTQLAMNAAEGWPHTLHDAKSALMSDILRVQSPSLQHAVACQCAHAVAKHPILL